MKCTKRVSYTVFEKNKVKDYSMKQEYNSKVVKSKHLTSSERGKIETYVEAKMSISEIARKMGRAKSTICVEIRRSRYNGRYDANIAHKRAQKRRKESHKHTKWRDVNLLNFIEKHLKKRWSPEIISMQLKKEKGWKFSHSSIYTLIKSAHSRMKCNRAGN